jgi:hypothetical protein
VLAATPVDLDEIVIRKCRLGILVEILQVRVRQRAVKVVVVFLDVLAVIPLAVAKPEEALLENRGGAIPERQAKTELLLRVRNAGQAVLAPAIGTRTSLVVADIVPGVAVWAEVLARRAPLAIAQVWSSFLPGNYTLS